MPGGQPGDRIRVGVTVPWVPLEFDRRLGIDSAAAGDPEEPFYDAPPGQQRDAESVWMRDYDRPVPLHTTQAFFDGNDNDAPAAGLFRALLPAGGAHSLRRPSDSDDEPDFGPDDRPHWNPAPTAEFLAIRLGDVIRYVASRTVAPSPVLDGVGDWLPPDDITAAGYPRLVRAGDPASQRYTYDFDLEPGQQIDVSFVVSVYPEAAPVRPRPEAAPPDEPGRPDPFEADGAMVGIGSAAGLQQDLAALRAAVATGPVLTVGAGKAERIHAGIDIIDLRDTRSFAEGGAANFLQIGRTGFYGNYSPRLARYGRLPSVPGDDGAPTPNRSLLDGLGTGDRRLPLGQPLGPDLNRLASQPLIPNAGRPRSQRFRFYISIGRFPDRLVPRPPGNACPRLLFARVSVQMAMDPPQIATHTFADSPYHDFGVFPDNVRLPPQQDAPNRGTYLPICARPGDVGVFVGGFSNRSAGVPGTRVEVEDLQARLYRRFPADEDAPDGEWVRTVV